MRNILRVFPALLGAFPPDMLDEAGFPLMEGTTTRFPGQRRRSPDYSSCPYAGSRFKQPMNLGALRAIQRNQAAWRDAADIFRQVVAVDDLEPLASAFKLAHACQYLPYVVNPSGSSTVGQGVADAFRFFRGVAYYGQHRLVYSTPRHSKTSVPESKDMAGYSEVAGLFVGNSEVCPAPAGLVGSIETELFTRLRAPFEISRSQNPSNLCTTEQMLNAVQLSGLLTSFCVASALHVMLTLMESPADASAREERLALPIPYVRWAIRAVRDGQESQHLQGLSRLLEAARVSSLGWQSMRELLQRIQAEPFFDTCSRQAEAIAAAEVLNRELVELLSLGPPPEREAFASTLKSILYP